MSHFIVAAVILLVVLVIAWVLYRKHLRNRPAPVPDGVEDLLDRVRFTFAKARIALHQGTVQRTLARLGLRHGVSGPISRRLLFIGPPASGKTVLLQQLSRGKRYSRTLEAPEEWPCNLFKLENSLGVELSGRLLFDEDAAANGGDAFKAALQELSKLSKGEPIDGIVLALSCASLLPQADVSLNAESARSLRKRINELRERLGVEVPVYVVVTQCESIQAFAEFCASVSDRRQQILGWSNPQEEPTENPPNWTDMAFACLTRDLAQDQIYKFGTELLNAALDGYFVFPSALAECKPALGSYVDCIFREKPEQAPRLRGIYFVGCPERSTDVSAPAQTQTGSTASDARQDSILFTADLFDGLILREAGLAEPTRLAELKRNKWVRNLYLATALIGLVAVVILAVQAIKLSRQAGNLFEALNPLPQEIDEYRASVAGATSTEIAVTRRELAIRQLDRIGKVTTSTLTSWFIPISKLSDLDARLLEAFRLSYGRFILKSFEDVIEPNRTYEGVSLQDGKIPDADMPLETTPEYRNAESWLQHLEILEQSITQFNCIIHGGKSCERIDKIDSVAELSKNLLKHNVTDAFRENARHFTSALDNHENVNTCDTEVLSKDLKQRTRVILEQLNERVVKLASFPIPDAIGKLQVALNKLDPQNDRAFDVADLEYLGKAIQGLDSELGRASLTRLASKSSPLPAMPDDRQFTPGDESSEIKQCRTQLELLGNYKEYAAMLDRFGKIDRLLEPSIERDYLCKLVDRLSGFQISLRDMKLPVVGALLKPADDGSSQMKLAPEIIGLLEPIVLLRAQEFMQGDLEPPVQLETEPGRVVWDVEPLKRAARTIKEFDTSLREGSFSKFTFFMRPKVGKLEKLARRRVMARTEAQVKLSMRSDIMADLVQNATDTLAADAANLAAAMRPIGEILSGLKTTHLDDTEAKVRGVLIPIGRRLLQALQSDLLNKQRLYAGRVDNWEIGGVPAFEIFDVTNEDQLETYLAKERGRAERIALQLVDPILPILEDPEAPQGSSLAAFWRNMINALHDSESKKSDNSVDELERFIKINLKNIVSYKNCISELSKVPKPNGRSDFFIERREDLRHRLFDKCLSESQTKLDELCNEFENESNKLMGHFPFTRLKQPEEDEAEALEVRSFLDRAAQVYEAFGGMLNGLVKKRALAEFLEHAKSAHDFMAPLWDMNDAADGFYDVDVKFRANTAHETIGSEIAEWSLLLGETRLTLGGPKTKARWRIEDPVRVQFRWAKDATTVPRPSPKDGLTVDRDARVTADYKGKWALLRLIAEHSDRSLDLGVQATKLALLRFQIPTESNPDGSFLDRISAQNAQVFLALRLTSVVSDKSAVDKDKTGAAVKTLTYPVFPTSCTAH